MEYTHNCLKCQTIYKDSDPDPYYCESCLAERKLIASEIDKKFPPRIIPKTPSDLELFDMQAKVFTSPNGRSVTFAKAKL